MKTVVALPGEGIGPEVVDATCELLMGTGLPLKILTPPQPSSVIGLEMPSSERCHQTTSETAQSRDFDFHT